MFMVIEPSVWNIIQTKLKHKTIMSRSYKMLSKKSLKQAMGKFRVQPRQHEFHLAAIDLQKELHFHRTPRALMHGWILHCSRLRFPSICFGRQMKYLWYSTKYLLLSKSVKTRGKTRFCYAGVETSPCLIHQCWALERLVVLLFKKTLRANVSPEPVVSHRR